MSPRTIVNGIDVGRQRAAASWSESAEITTSTEWLGGTQTRTLVAPARRESDRGFTIDADYPESLLGSGIAPSPNELFLAALGSSFVTTFVLAAAAADIRIDYMRVLTTRAAIDGPREQPDDGLELHVDVDADETLARLEDLAAIALERSAVLALCRLKVRTVLEVVMSGGLA
jgi:uncharacterized OsmC-like protein